MITRVFLNILFAIVSLMITTAGAETEIFPVEVYSDENMSIQAGITNLEDRIVHVGDVLPLYINITYDSSRVRLQETGTSLFTDSWPESKGAYLLDQEFSTLHPDRITREIRSVYRFQILGCPDGGLFCKGMRRYEIPELEIDYQILDQSGNEVSMETLKFRPWPGTVMVTSTIPPGEDGELHRFAEYFPTGAYPSPLPGKDYYGTYYGLIAGGLFLLLGGILMTPFKFLKRKAFVPKSRSRWEQIYDQLKSGEFEQEERFTDALRRCIVWYCTDELGVDPFYWVKHEEEMSGQQQKGADEFAELKDLFITILHNPPGRGKEMFEQFQVLAANR